MPCEALVGGAKNGTDKQEQGGEQENRPSSDSDSQGHRDDVPNAQEQGRIGLETADGFFTDACLNVFGCNEDNQRSESGDDAQTADGICG